jgi:hypothetical protein
MNPSEQPKTSCCLSGYKVLKPIRSSPLLLLFFFFTPHLLPAQDLSGNWNGKLDVGGKSLRLVFSVVPTDSGYASTMDSPDQGVKGIPVDRTLVRQDSVYFEIKAARIEYSGELKNGVITGTFRQSGHELPLNLSRGSVDVSVPKRPQTPVPPFPYYTEDVYFTNTGAGIRLSGTLTLPKKEGTFPVVVLISGSGPQNRDEELLGHKPFLVLADHLTRNGIGVLRFDDRGVGSSGGSFEKATTADFATDVEHAVAYLKTRSEVDKKRIGLIGHSEGGIIAPLVASRTKDVKFIVMLAGTGIPGDQLLLLQQYLIGKAGGAGEEKLRKNEAINREVFALVGRSNNLDELDSSLTQLLARRLKDFPEEKPEGMSGQDFIRAQVKGVANTWMYHFLRYDPAPALTRVTCPVLALNGMKDLQVPARENLDAIRRALDKAGNRQFSIREYPGLNHLFQECVTGSPDEYATIEQTMAPVVLNDISGWILGLKL